MLYEIFCWIGIAYLVFVGYCGCMSLWDVFRSDDEDLKQ